MNRVPVDDTVIYALARLVDDSQTDRRDPSHSDIEFQIKKAGLESSDPNKNGRPVGKEKRVRAVLTWGVENKSECAESFVAGLISSIKGCGGFRVSSPNYVGSHAIKDLSGALKNLGVSLAEDGSLTALALENLSGESLSKALEIYIQRAKKGIEDAALVVGTSKDLMEAVSAHVLQEIWGQYPTTANFPTLLSQAFTALGMSTPAENQEPKEHPRKKLEREMYELACAINGLRNKQGTGHGRPWLPDVTSSEARAAVEFIGVISERMLSKLRELKG